ncbi:MAG TPA: hypothetical protein VGK10_06330 [Prolixibacteraceae bacterium]|jgi:hypothetical protein
MCRSLILFLFLIFTISVSGQKLNFEADLIVQSRHLWRGSQLGDAMAVEPSVTGSAGRFSLNIWASQTINNSYSEIDLIPSWQFNFLAISVLDYYNPVVDETNQFLNFQKERSRHSVELTLDNYSVEKRRFKWMIGTMVLGDPNEETGNQNFSTYLEFKHRFTIFGIDIEPFTGLTPFRGFYARKLAVINSGLSLEKDLDFHLPFTIPLNLSFVLNPYTSQRFVTFATGIAF